MTAGMEAAGAVKILGISGGLVDSSGAARLLQIAGEAADRLSEPAGPAVLELFDLHALRDLPHFEVDEAPRNPDELPESARSICGAVADADAILISTPEHHGSYPGVIKDAVDWVGSPAACGFEGLPAAVIGAGSDRYGADWAQADLRKVLDVAGARVLASELSVPMAGDSTNGGDTLNDEVLSRRLADLVGELAIEARARRSLDV